MADLISYAAAAIVLIAAIVKYRTIRPARPTPAQRHLLVVLVAFAPAHALAVPLTQSATAQIDPFPFATSFMSHALAMIAGNSLVFMLAHVLDDPVSALIRARWRGATALLVVTVLVMAALLVASGVEFHAEFATISAQHATLVAYQLVFLGFMAFCAGWFILLLRRYLSRPDVEPLMRWGMRVVVLSAGVGLAWLGWAVLTMAVSHAGGQLVNRPAVVAAVVGAVCVTLMAVGSTLSAFGAWLPTKVRRWRVRSALHDLTPLWRILAGVLPEVTFRPADLTDPEDVLYRRVIEIRDAQVTLTCYIPPAIEAEVLAFAAIGHAAEDRVAVRAEAAMLAVAIDAYRAGCQPTASALLSDPSAACADALVEARRLIQVRAALCYDPIVARITQQARQRLGVGPPQPAVGIGGVIDGHLAAVATQHPRVGTARSGRELPT